MFCQTQTLCLLYKYIFPPCNLFIFPIYQDSNLEVSGVKGCIKDKVEKNHFCELILEEIRGKGVRDFYLQVVLVVQSQYHNTFSGLTSRCQIIILF